eukprot:TRINITY_DN23768_c0_g1_i1.p1 TRINITY_DN23768_c0_g1~~TRINITY_DN23768_c0_g1_i1.p1  ORF type:complete len:230 (-),score=14.30 TRINITY_DN23768_c0_g1_i1:114-803(-)
MDASLARYANEAVKSLGILMCAMIADIVSSSSQQSAICILTQQMSCAKVAVALILLSFSRRVSFRAPGAGAVPVTAQTLVLCVNGFLFHPRVSLAATCLYVWVGIAAACLPTEAKDRMMPFGPVVSMVSAGYVAGFVVSSAFLASTWAQRSISGDEIFARLLGAIATFVAAQLAVLVCGAIWLMARRGLGFNVSVAPYLPGLLIKAVAAALLVNLCREIDLAALCVEYP